MKNELKYLILKLILMVGVLLAMVEFVVGINRYIGNGMNLAFKDGDLLFYDRMRKKYQTDQVIVFEKNGEDETGRIVAVSGDVVDVTPEGLVVNGILQKSKDTEEETLPYEEGIRYPVELGPDEYFVLGDSRTTAKDSRIFGTVKSKEIKGKVITVIRRRGI